MRERKYLSYSQYATYKKDGAEAYYEKYLSENIQPRAPQTLPMAIGSAFDCFAKARLSVDSGGEDTFKELFKDSVEEQNREEAFDFGFHCMDEYLELGAYADLVLIMSQSLEDPRFEFESIGILENELGTVPVRGIPDCRFTLPSGAYFFLDWKVNGYMSKGNTSPKPGYVKLFPGFKTHKDAIPMEQRDGIWYSSRPMFEDWADQLSIYAVLGGHEAGNIYCGVDQLVFKENSTEFPDCRVAQHRSIIPEAYWRGVIDGLVKLWDLVNSDHFFRDKTKKESDELCKLLDIKVDDDFAAAVR
jgi:hypothetical protein